MKKYIIVAWYGGIPYMLQMRGVINWCFYNNRIKTFKTLETAIRNVNKIAANYKYDIIKVYAVNNNEIVSSDNIRKWDLEESERIVFAKKAK